MADSSTGERGDWRGIDGELSTRPAKHLSRGWLEASVNQRSAWLRTAPLFGLGGIILVLALAHVLTPAGPLISVAMEAGILVVFAVSVLIVAVRAASEELDRRSVIRILGFTIGVSVVVGALSGVYVLSRFVSGEILQDGEFVLSIGFSLGAGVGALLGYYFNRYEMSLSHETEVSRRLTILQRILRHNIRNEVAIIEGVSQDLSNHVDDPEVIDGLETITTHIGNVHRVAEKSQDLAAVWRTDQLVTIDVVTTLRESIEDVSAAHPAATFLHQFPDQLVVRAHPRIGIAFTEAMDNAARHNEDVEIEVEASSADESAVISVTDSGSGIPAAEISPLQHGHERPLDHTTGIGLWSIYWLVIRSGGDLEFSESETGGTVVAISLPLV